MPLHSMPMDQGDFVKLAFLYFKENQIANNVRGFKTPFRPTWKRGNPWDYKGETTKNNANRTR